MKRPSEYECKVLALIQQAHPTKEQMLMKKIYWPNGTVREATYYVTKTFVRVLNGSGTHDFTYVYVDGQLVAQRSNGTTLFIHGNHEGSSSVVTNASGSVVETTTYTPFGEVLTGGTATRFGYEGKEHDSLVGDTDFHFRKYKAEWAIFLQPDDIIQNVYDPQILNRYAFERNSPYKYRDDDGHSLALVIGGGAFLLGAANYWFWTPIDPANPQWGDRFVKGALHGLNWAAHSMLALEAGVVGGATRVIPVSWGKSFVAGASSHLWDNNIDGTRTTVTQTVVAGSTSAATANLGGAAKPGTYVATVKTWTKQNYKQLVDEITGLTAEEALNKGINWLQQNWNSLTNSQQATPQTDITSTSSYASDSTDSGSGSGVTTWNGGQGRGYGGARCVRNCN